MTKLHEPVTHAQLTVDALRRWPAREAFRQDGVSITYAQAGNLLARYVAMLRERGLAIGQGIGVLSGNRPEVWVARTAATLAGGRYTALHPLGSLDDHRYACDEAELRFLFVDSAYAARAADLLEVSPAVETVFTFGPADVGEDAIALADKVSPGPLEAGPIRADDVGWLLYTGGTTGVPKAAELTDGAVALMALGVSSGWDLPKERRYLACAPISHAAGMLVTPTLLAGGTVILQKGFDPGAWISAVRAERATLSLLVPTMIYAVLDHDDLDGADLSPLETVMYGASPMSPTRLVEAIERIGPKWCQLYGQTESAGMGTSLWREQHDPSNLERLTSCGQPMPGVRVEVLDADGNVLPTGEAGEICIQGATVMRGYFKQPELTAEALGTGWLRTGDMAVRDEEGFFYIVDRKKDMIVSGGFNVFPREIEDVLTTHPAVASAAVIGVPDDKWGEVVTALVVVRPSMSVDPADLSALVRDRKGPVYAPKTVELVESLPLTPVGKPDKKVLRARYWGDRDRRVN